MWCTAREKCHAPTRLKDLSDENSASGTTSPALNGTTAHTRASGGLRCGS